MAKKVEKPGIRHDIKTGYVLPSSLSDMPVRAQNLEMDKVFKEANKRLSSLWTLDNIDPNGLPAIRDLEDAVDLGSFSINPDLNNMFKTGDDMRKMPAHERVAAYQAAVDFLGHKTSVRSEARSYAARARKNLIDALQSGRDYAILASGGNAKSVRGASYLEKNKNYPRQLFRDVDGDKIEISYNSPKGQHKITIQSDDNIYGVIGRILNSVGSTMNELGLSTSPGVTETNSKNGYRERYVDILAKYLYSKTEYSLDEIIQKSVDEFYTLAQAAKDPGATSNAPRRNQGALRGKK